MNHADIQKAIRERIAEIDRSTSGLAEERAKLQAMLGGATAQPVKDDLAEAIRRLTEKMPQPAPVFVPMPYPQPWPPSMVRPWYQEWPYGVTICTTQTSDTLPLRVDDLDGRTFKIDCAPMPYFGGTVTAFGSTIVS